MPGQPTLLRPHTMPTTRGQPLGPVPSMAVRASHWWLWGWFPVWKVGRASRPALCQAAALKMNKCLPPPAPTSAFPALFNGCDCNRRGLFCHRRCLVVHRAGWVSQASGASLGAYSHLELVYVGKRFCHPNNSHRKEF